MNVTNHRHKPQHKINSLFLEIPENFRREFWGSAIPGNSLEFPVILVFFCVTVITRWRYRYFLRSFSTFSKTFCYFYFRFHKYEVRSRFVDFFLHLYKFDHNDCRRTRSKLGNAVDSCCCHPYRISERYIPVDSIVAAELNLNLGQSPKIPVDDLRGNMLELKLPTSLVTDRSLLSTILQKWVPYSQRYLLNAIPDTNHNDNPTNPNTR